MSSTMNFGYEEDCFGFTKQTAVILEGLGIGNSIQKFKDRNISTQALSQLSKDDFITLGVNEDIADVIIKQLSSRVDKHNFRVLNIEDNSRQLIDIVKNGNQQLLFIHAFITYTRLRLLQTPTDYIIDSDNNMRASEALCTVTNCVIQEISNFEKNLKDLSAIVCEDDVRKKRFKKRILCLISGIGLSACLIYTWSCVVGSLRRS